MSVGSQGWLEKETSIPIFCAVIVRGLFQEEEEAQGGGELTNPFSEGRTVSGRRNSRCKDSEQRECLDCPRTVKRPGSLKSQYVGKSGRK